MYKKTENNNIPNYSNVYFIVYVEENRSIQLAMPISCNNKITIFFIFNCFTQYMYLHNTHNLILKKKRTHLVIRACINNLLNNLY